jgi:hypothetical protein
MSIKRVQINKDILSYVTAKRDDWIFKASVYKDKYILLIGYNDTTGDFFTRSFADYDNAVIFIEALATRGYGGFRYNDSNL